MQHARDSDTPLLLLPHPMQMCTFLLLLLLLLLAMLLVGSLAVLMNHRPISCRGDAAAAATAAAAPTATAVATEVPLTP
jgi:hypothetical protein